MPTEIPQTPPARPTTPPSEAPAGDPGPDIPAPIQEPGGSPRPEELPGSTPSEVPGSGGDTPQPPNPATDVGSGATAQPDVTPAPDTPQNTM